MDPAFQQQLITQHFRHPRHRGQLDRPSGSARVTNPFCGDEVTVHVRVEGDRIAEAAFEGRGCTISQASASMLMSLIQDASTGEAEALVRRFTAFVKGEGGEADGSLRDLTALEGVSRFPTRIRCALLPFDALTRALTDDA